MHNTKLVDRLFKKTYMTFRDTLGGTLPGQDKVPPLEGAPKFTPPEDYEAAAALYSNRYRGAFIINFALGFVAVALALVPLAGILPEHWEHVAAIPLTVAEIACITSIMLIHWYGRDAEAYETTSSRWLRRIGFTNINQGWRARWGHARLAAEHLRFAELMVCFPGAKLAADGILEGAGERYRATAATLHAMYAQCPAARSDTAYDAAYHAHFRAVIRDQSGYHRDSAHRYHRIAHRLHHFANACFYATLGVCALHLALHHPGLSALAALLPALGATCHGILAAGEFHKLSGQSHDMQHALDILYAEVGKTPPSLLPELESQVRAFFALVTKDALGWHVTLSDKDVHPA